MTLTQLHYIVAVAEQLHFARAAETCFVSQPTLSIAVGKLEEELGVRIFERSRSEVLITAAGEKIIAQARDVLREAEQLKAIAAAAQDPLGGQLALGVIFTIGPYLIPRFIARLRELAPNLGLIIREDFTEKLAAALRSGSIDAAIMSLPYQDPRLVSRPLYDEPFKVAMPTGHPLARNKQIKASQLADETLLLLGAGNCFREQVLDACPHCRGPAASTSDMQKTLEGSSLETICQMVAAGAGVTILPGTMGINAELRPLIKLRPFAPPGPSRQVAVFYRRGFARPELIDCVARAVRKAGLSGVRHCS